MTELKNIPSLDIEEILKAALTPKRLTSMEFKELENSVGQYSFRLQGTGEREGSSDINIKQINGELIVTDCVKLPYENRGFERDIALLKKTMYYDLGTTASGDVRELIYSVGSKGNTVSFKVSAEKAQKALFHYINIAAYVMSGFSRGLGEIDLAFSLARARVGR